MLIAMPLERRASVNASAVSWLPWSVLKISGQPYFNEPLGAEPYIRWCGGDGGGDPASYPIDPSPALLLPAVQFLDLCPVGRAILKEWKIDHEFHVLGFLVPCDPLPHKIDQFLWFKCLPFL